VEDVGDALGVGEGRRFERVVGEALDGVLAEGLAVRRSVAFAVAVDLDGDGVDAVVLAAGDGPRAVSGDDVALAEGDRAGPGCDANACHWCSPCGGCGVPFRLPLVRISLSAPRWVVKPRSAGC